LGEEVKQMSEAAANWFEDEGLWSNTYRFMFPASSFDQAIQHADQITDLSGFHGGALLDLCCGPGRYAVPLALRGFSVTGVDRTSFLLDKAREYAVEKGAAIEWVLEDMRRFIRAESFDLAINMFTSFGYFDDPEENMGVLRNVHASLKRQGVFIIDVAGKEILARIFEATGSKELQDDSLIVQRRQVTDDWSRMENEWLLIKDASMKTLRLRHWIYSGRELREMLEAAGFSSVTLHGDLDGSPYNQLANRLVAVARKP
jgi:SAM-dependent methyltransferase